MKLTREDILKIQEEIDYRKGTLRQELLMHLREARAQGDLSENFEYTMAKRQNNQNNNPGQEKQHGMVHVKLQC